MKQMALRTRILQLYPKYTINSNLQLFYKKNNEQ